MSTLSTSPQPAGGNRLLSLTMIAVRDRGDQFQGVAPGAGKPLTFLAAFQEAEPYLNLPSQAYKLVAWLVKQTMPQDWEQGSRPICWPSASRQAEFLGLSPARVKFLNRQLYEAGIFIIRDSETGKRYGRRDSKGRIIEAFGFDLSPLAYRHEEFIRLAAAARVEREKVRTLRKRATRARRAIAQAGAVLATLPQLPEAWPRLEAETADLVAGLRKARTSDELAVLVQGLESRKEQADALVLAAKAASTTEEAAQSNDKTNPTGLVFEPHNISTNLSLNPKDTVIASKGRSDGGDAGAQSPASSGRTGAKGGDEVAFRPFERVERLHAAELMELAPRLAASVDRLYPDWNDIVDAAGGKLRVDLGISISLWGRACEVLGRQQAAIALAIVSTKPTSYFYRGAGGYFGAMIKRAEQGDLHLDRSLWKLRRAKWAPEAKSVQGSAYDA